MEPTHVTAGDPLTSLQEIPLPPSVPYVPQTTGWVVVGVLLLAVVAFVAWRAIRHHRANAYRREALAELAQIEAGLPSKGVALPALLKRTAIAANSRDEVASLSGSDWLRFLDRSFGGSGFSDGPGKLLPRLAYGTSVPAGVSEDQLRALIDLSRRWIRHHHADV